MDLSDGLLGDLPKMLVASAAAARLDAAAIPVAAAVRALFPDDWLTLATRGGEDYELLFTAPPAALATIRAEAAGIGATVTAIGAIVAAAGRPALTMRGLDGREETVAAGAFDHFRPGG
jgi:thiamine-monophosphate kinase